MKNLNLALVLSVFAVITSACGNVNMTGGSVGTTTSGLQTGATSSTPSTSVSGTAGLALAEQCSANPNVVASGLNNTIHTEYHACSPNLGTTGGVKIFNEDLTTKTVCVFAANQANNNQVSVFLMNPYAAIENAYAVQCVSVNSNAGVSMAFPNLNFNSVYVVDQANEQMMAQCFESGQVASCAANSGFTYSFGQFR